MDLEEVHKISRLGESEILELKKSTGERREAAIATCAMANTRGGHVIFGIASHGEVVGQFVSDRTVEEVVQEFRQISPPIYPKIERVKLRQNKELIVICVSKEKFGPYSYKGQAYKRIGNTNRIMSSEEYNRILIEKIHSTRRWENEIADDCSFEDIDEELLMNVLNDSIKINRTIDPIIAERSGCVVVTFLGPSDKSARRLIECKILRMLENSPNGLAIQQIEDLLLNISRRRIKYELMQIQKKGLAKNTGKGRSARWKIV